MLFQPAAAWRVHRSTWTDTPLPPDEPLAANPPDGAVIEYFLPHDAKHAVTLEVLDGGGKVVRRYASDDPSDPPADELARELIPAYWLKPPRVLPASAGMHRWVWNLRYAAPVSTEHGYPISAVPHATPRQPEGPLALPGSYVVRLTVDGRKLEAPLTLKLDPRVQVPAGALADQLRLASELAGLLTESSEVVLNAQSEQAQLKALRPSGPAAQAVAAYEGRVTALLEAKESKETAGAKPEKSETPSRSLLPEVQGHISSLYGELQRGDAAPTAAQMAAAAAAREAFAGLLADWRKVQADLPDLNRQLKAAGLSPVRADLAPPRDVNVADEE
jgi:hypothetical protein